VKLDLLPDVEGNAWFSGDRTYRYLLTRTWAPTWGANSVLWVMLNPSIGGSDEDDRTLRRCQDFTRAWGYDGIAVVNPVRAPDPVPVRAARTPRPGRARQRVSRPVAPLVGR